MKSHLHPLNFARWRWTRRTSRRPKKRRPHGDSSLPTVEIPSESSSQHLVKCFTMPDFAGWNSPFCGWTLPCFASPKVWLNTPLSFTEFGRFQSILLMLKSCSNSFLMLKSPLFRARRREAPKEEAKPPEDPAAWFFGQGKSMDFTAHIEILPTSQNWNPRYLLWDWQKPQILLTDNSFGGIKKNDDLISTFNHQRVWIWPPKNGFESTKNVFNGKKES